MKAVWVLLCLALVLLMLDFGSAGRREGGREGGRRRDKGDRRRPRPGDSTEGVEAREGQDEERARPKRPRPDRPGKRGRGRDRDGAGIDTNLDVEIPHGQTGHVHHESHESHQMHDGGAGHVHRESQEMRHGQPGHGHHENHESHEMHHGEAGHAHRESHEIRHGQPGHVHHESHESHEMHGGHAHHGHHAHGGHGDAPGWMRGRHHSSHTPQFHRFLQTLVGHWSNRQQVIDEATQSIPADQRHPPFESIITPVRMRPGMFPEGHVTVVFQDKMQTRNGSMSTWHLMSVMPHGQGIHMKIYKFRDPAVAEDLDNLVNLEADELFFLGEDCEQHWTISDVGWNPRELLYNVNGTTGVCMGRSPTGDTLIMEFGTSLRSSSLELTYNIRMLDGTPLMYWPTPFSLTRLFNFKQVLDKLNDGDEMHFCVDLRQCQGGSDEDLPESLDINIIGGPMNEFQYVDTENGMQPYIRYTSSELVVPHTDDGEKRSRLTEVWYYGNESITVKLMSAPIGQPGPPVVRILQCEAQSGGMMGSNVFQYNRNPRKRLLVGYEAVAHALHQGVNLRLVVDMERCNSTNNPMAVVKSGGTRIQIHSVSSKDGQDTINFNTMSLSPNTFAESGIMAGGAHVVLTAGSGDMVLNQWGMAVNDWTMYFGTRMVCSIEEQAARVYQV